jgi:hypothetical protein
MYYSCPQNSRTTDLAERPLFNAVLGPIKLLIAIVFIFGVFAAFMPAKSANHDSNSMYTVLASYDIVAARGLTPYHLQSSASILPKI